MQVNPLFCCVMIFVANNDESLSVYFPILFSTSLSFQPYQNLFQLKFSYVVNLCVASETLALLQPIFDSIRANGSPLCSFPLSSSSVSFGRSFSRSFDPLLRRTNLPRISVSHHDLVSSDHVMWSIE